MQGLSLQITIYTNAYAPLIGGQETVARILATKLKQRGHEVTILCENPGDRSIDGIKVERGLRWHGRAWKQSAAEANIVFGATIRGLLSFFPARKPIIWHQTWLPQESDFSSMLRRSLLSRGQNVAASRALANHLPVSAQVVPNAYDESVFVAAPLYGRSNDLLFVGRLVSDKGVSLLLRALVSLRAEGLSPSLTVVGSGTEEVSLKREVGNLGLEPQVTFMGSQIATELAKIYARHRVLVVPSIWQEPFGIVALEGLACGCSVVTSNSGGLPEAVGTHGAIFIRGDHLDLAMKIRHLLCNQNLASALRDGIHRHLEDHTSAALVARFEQLLVSV